MRTHAVTSLESHTASEHLTVWPERVIVGLLRCDVILPLFGLEMIAPNAVYHMEAVPGLGRARERLAGALGPG